MSDQRPDPIPPFPTDDDKSAAYHVAMGSIDGIASFLPVPGLSYGAQQIVRQLIDEPLERRREKWFASVGEGLRELQDRLDGFDPANLAGDEEFVSVVAETTRIAMTTHRAEKLEALRNVVLNTAAGVRLDDVLQKTFLGYVDRFSGLHLKVLKIMANPAAIPAIEAKAQNMMAGALIHILPLGLPEIAGNEDLLERVMGDLNREELIAIRDLQGMMSGSGLLTKWTTPLGDAFLRFVAGPASI